ncbi:hypothetical protein K435DRAFT_849456 [Dendrothele bispora CBS 962.96]|uniref:Protein YOP1 n=1 Tax=Dendrothele bispora (strain CBS 962.96) TaxID=1314807 RepID=A0A4S8MS95_DENBC|nr:hypothetical protein K435DRAFT_849456 [Dendrothele bispora CBS 962.96]
MFSIFFSLICAWFAYFLPCFATYKTLSRRPVVEADVERWCMYWSVVGAFVGFEYVAEWFCSWLPFYWEIKTLFLLFLSLPQIQGSTFIYTTYMQPFFVRNESEIEAGIAQFQTSALAFVQARLATLWELLWSVISKTPANGQPPSAEQQQQGAGAPMSFESAMGMFKAVAPSFLNSFQPAAHAPTPPSMTPAASSSSVATAASLQPRTPAAPDHAAPSFPEPVNYQ